MARSTAGEAVLERAARLLESFEHDRQVLTAAQLARRANLPIATAHRLVAQLVAVGFLERTGRSGIRIGLRLWEIASHTPQAGDLREAAMPFLEDVQATTRQHTQLAVLDGLDVIVIERLKARDALPNVLLKAGRRIPAHAVATGLVLLSHAGPQVQDEVIQAPLRRYNPRTPTEPDRLRQLWSFVRSQGYLVCDGFIHREARSIAVPVRGAGDAVIASLGVVIPSAGAVATTYVPVLLAAARGIRRAVAAAAVPGRTRTHSYLPPTQSGDASPVHRSECLQNPIDNSLA